MKVFQDLGAKNLEPVRVAVVLKHPFIQDLISSYSDYKIPVSIIPKCPNSVALRIRAWWDISNVNYRDGGERGWCWPNQGQDKPSWQKHQVREASL